MAYTINMPGANDRINATQPLIRDNFNEINADFQRNHVGLLTPIAANRGKHSVVTFPLTGAGLALANNEMKIYNAASINGNPDLFVQRNIAGVDGVAYPFTASSHANNGWTYLPSGLLLKWGTFLNDGLPQNFPVNATIPAFAHIYSAQVTTISGGANTYSAQIFAINILSIQIRTVNIATHLGANCYIYYFVIGD